MELIKKVIKAKGFTLEQVASQMKNKNGGIGISQPSLSQMLNGNPSVSRVVEIAKIIGVSVSELIGEDGLYEIRSEEDARAYSALVSESSALFSYHSTAFAISFVTP